jgi:hypothetical protein
MNSTIELLRFVGSPYSSIQYQSIDFDSSFRLFQCSYKNRMTLLFLNAIKRTEVFDKFDQIYHRQIAQYNETIQALARISSVLSKENVKHAIFKTLRPYISTTVDIDVITFGNDFQYERACRATHDAGYQKVVRGPLSTTFLDPKIRIGVDLYNEIAVSYVPYINKDKLLGYIVDAELSNHDQIKVLKCEADLMAIIAHSVIKEQMYTLSEYYTFIHYLEHINPYNFVHIVKQNNLLFATSVHASITALLHKIAHDTIPKKLQQILDSLYEGNYEIDQMFKKHLRTPHKYHPITMIKSLLEITKGAETRRGVATLLIHLLDRNVSKDFLKKSIGHIFRETY